MSAEIKEGTFLKDVPEFRIFSSDQDNLRLAFNRMEGSMKNPGPAYITTWHYKENPDVGFSYWSHFGRRRNFREDQICLGFIRIDMTHYLFVTCGRIESVPTEVGPCGRKEFPEGYENLKKFVGRLVVHIDLGDAAAYGRYVFTAQRFWDSISVVDVLPEGTDTRKYQFNF